MKIEFMYDPWYSSTGCSCCDPNEMESYTLKIDDVLQTTKDGTPLQFMDEGAISIYVLKKLGINSRQVDSWEDDA